jgi:magnesium transporter
MIVDLAVYTNGVRRPQELALANASEACQQPDSFVWLGLFEPSFDEFDEVREQFGLHGLAVEDAVRAHQRPKVETYGDSLFVVLRTARYIDESETVEFGEIQVFVGECFVVSVRHSEASKLKVVRHAIEQQPDLLSSGPSAVLYAIVDRVVDDYLPVIDGIEHDLREVEAQVFTPERTNPAERIFKLKREVLDFQRNSEPLLEALEILRDGSMALVEPEMNDYFRDVEDHLLRFVARINSLAALLSDALSANLAHVSVRQNDDMRTISAWVAIAVIPTVFAGIYGMNFEHMPELGHTWGYPAVLAVMFTVCSFAWWRFKRAGWL